MRLRTNSDCIISCLSVVASWISKKGWESVPTQFKTMLILNIIDLSNICVNYFYGSTFFISFHHGARQISASLAFFLCSSAYQFLELPRLSIIICLLIFHSFPITIYCLSHLLSLATSYTALGVSYSSYIPLLLSLPRHLRFLGLQNLGCCLLKEKNTQTQTPKPSLSHAYAFTLPGFSAVSQGLLSALKGSNIWK